MCIKVGKLNESILCSTVKETSKYPRRRHAAVIKQILMKSSPNHFANIMQGTKTDDAAVMSLHVIHYQLVRDMGNH